MKVIRTEIPEVLILEPKVFEDPRGFFLESYNRKTFMEATGVDTEFVQDNHSHSKKNILRGLHYQIGRPQGKLIRVTFGEIWDVAVDLRKSSRTFGKWAGFHLKGVSKQIAWIPPGFAHGFVVISAVADVQYKATDYYSPQHERVLLWNDAEVGVRWPVANPVLNERDKRGTPLQQAEVFP
jgi:dTDP-4-dehydrorhamnose 3,5-epimerase